MNKKIFARHVFALISVLFALFAMPAMPMGSTDNASDIAQIMDTNIFSPPAATLAVTPDLEAVPLVNTNDYPAAFTALPSDLLTAYSVAAGDFWQTSPDMPVSIGRQLPGYSAVPDKVAIRFRF